MKAIVKTDRFIPVLESAAAVMAEDYSRPMLAGVQFQASDGVFSARAADGWRLVKADCDALTEGQIDAVVDRVAVLKLTQALRPYEEQSWDTNEIGEDFLATLRMTYEQVTIEQIEDLLTFELGPSARPGLPAISLSCPIKRYGSYPDLERLIPPDDRSSSRAAVNLDLLEGIISVARRHCPNKAVKVFPGGSESESLKLAWGVRELFSAVAVIMPMKVDWPDLPLSAQLASNGTA